MRIVVCTLGTSGDHNPYMAVAIELARHGHDVECVVDPTYAGSAAKLPLRAHAAGKEFPNDYILEHPELLHPRNAFYAITRQLLLPTAELQFRDIERLHAARKIDAVVAHHIAFGAIWWAESRGVPLTIGWLAPISLLNPDGLGSMLPGFARRTPLPLARVLRRFVIPALIRRQLDAPMNATRAALGLAPQRDAMVRLPGTGHGHVALWDEAFRAPAAGDPPGLVTCGFPLLAREGGEPPLPPEVAAFLDTKPAPIVCALGTTGGPIPLPIADLLAEACELAGRPALLIGDRAPVAARSSRWVAFAPHGHAFERAPLVVHHGGIGTLAAVLRAGKPSLVLPLANDQFDNAVRLRGLGAAAVLDPRKAKPAAMAGAIRKLLDDRATGEAAARLGERVRTSNGARRAADAIA
ncbi:MAG TPA: glycosyltransferase [Gammaproteobacteria bacterium]|nr:glycosyltransferase [Gammaproteobacteria bacterium]